MAERKLRRMVQQVLDGRLVPFLGAGVSFGAVHQRLPDWSGHRTDTMRRWVRDALVDLTASPEPPLPGALGERLRADREAEAEGHPAPPANLQLGELCELLVDRARGRGEAPYRRLVDVLEIAELRGLLPTRAHRFIAFLAREGLIGEVITTNYDCAVERAMAQSYGRDYTPEALEARGRELEQIVRPIRDLKTYREGGRSPRSAGGHARGASRHCLRVYKINGCAMSLTGAADERAAASILLTERQLQRWRDRVWAADLLRDRLRRASLLFCGFGSPEPQVRHTVGQVLEEFSADTDGGEGLLDQPNCVFVTGFDRDDTPTFHHWQIAAAFRDAHDPGGDPSDLVFGPDDANEIDPSRRNARFLPADDLWRWIYARAARWLLIEAFDPYRSRFAAELRGCLPIAGALCLELRDGALGRRADQETAGAWTETAWLRALSAWDEDGETTRASVWVRHLLNPGSRPPRGWYAPLVDHAHLLAWLVLVLEALDVDPEGASVGPDGLGLGVDWWDEATRTTIALSVTASELGALAGGGERIGQRTQIVLDHPVPRPAEGMVRTRERRRPVRRRGDRRRGAGGEVPKAPLHFTTLVRVRLSRLLHRHGDAVRSWEDMRRLVRDVVRHPTWYVREDAPRVAQRLRRGREVATDVA